MTYARARRRVKRTLGWTNRCIECFHLNLPEHDPFCSVFCQNVWSRKNDVD
jgi:rRNA maturation endonuclease Nob1